MDPFKKPKRAVEVGKTKNAGIAANAQSHLGMTATFSFRRYDAGTAWSVSSDKKPVVDSVFKVLYGFEYMTWIDILKANGGRRRGTNNHEIPISELSRDAVQRAEDIKLQESELFSLRLQGDVRLWGIIEPENGCFYVVWFDPNHQVYPVDK